MSIVTNFNRNRSALAEAVDIDHEDIVKVLLQSGAKVLNPVDVVYNAMRLAITKGQSELVQMLLEHDPDSKSDLDTFFLLSAGVYHQDTLEILLNAGADVNARDRRGRTAPANTSEEGFSEIVQFLIEAGAELNVADNLGFTAVMLATEYGDIKVARILVNAGADVNMATDVGLTALMLTVKKSHFDAIDQRDNDLAYEIDWTPDLIELLIKAGAGLDACDMDDYNVMMHAVKAEHTGAIKCLLKNGFDVNRKLPNGNTPLLFAIQSNRVEAAECLIKNGADLYETNPEGKACLFYAVEKRSLNMVQLLIDSGVDVDQRNGSDKTALVASFNPAAPHITRLLIQHTKDINQSWSDTPLQMAAMLGQLENARLLIEAGADLNLQGPIGLTPLMCATICDQTLAAKLLIESGCDVDAMSKYHGRTAFMMAVRRGNKHLMELLIENGADINKESNAGTNALIQAARDGFLNVVQLLVRLGATVDLSRSKRS